jgi:CheY-like chemotaxis protein
VPGALRDDRLPDLSQLKILVAEDNPTLQLMVSKMLGRLGAEFEIAGDGVEAVDWLQRERFDLLLLDIEMPRMSGLDVLKSVRRMPPPLDAMPVIVMTAFVLETNQQAIFGAGADGIIPKPISRLESFGTSILNHYHSALERPAAALPDDATPVEALRLRRLLEMSGEADREELLSRLEIDLCAARDGLRPAQGVVSGKEIRAITHILVALAGAIGAETLHENAKALNRAAHHEEDDRVEALRLRTLAQLDRLIPIVQSHKEEGDAAPDPGAAPYEKELQA